MKQLADRLPALRGPSDAASCSLWALTFGAPFVPSVATLVRRGLAVTARDGAALERQVSEALGRCGWRAAQDACSPKRAQRTPSGGVWRTVVQPAGILEAEYKGKFDPLIDEASALSFMLKS